MSGLRPCDATGRNRTNSYTPKPTVFLHDPPSVIRAVKDLCGSPLLFFGWFLKKFGPAMFTENAVKVRIISRDFNDDHASRLSNNGIVPSR